MQTSRLPVPAAIAAVALAASAAGGSYTVRSGDTLSGIAKKVGVSVADIAGANGLADPDRIYAGHVLRMPGAGSAPAAAGAAQPATEVLAGRTHVVAAGDALARLARRYGVSVAEIMKANNLKRPDLIRIGQRLAIPPPPPGPLGDVGKLPPRLRERPDRLALIPRFDHWAGQYDVPPDLLKAMTWLESGWQNHVVSSTGAVGIGQLMPSTVDFVSKNLLRTPLDPANPDDNIRMSARYLRYLLDKTGGDVKSSVASYYQGPASVKRIGVLPGTHAYVDAVLALRPRF